jgi:hypothetical protein
MSSSNRVTAKKGEIKIYRQGNFSTEDWNALEKRLEKIGPTGEVRESIPMSWDWSSSWSKEAIVPIVLLIIIGKGLLDGFLKEFGADGAKALKSILKRIFQDSQKERQRYITIFPDGVPTKNRFERLPLISIAVHLEISGLTARFDFPVNLSRDEASGAVESLSQAITFARELARAEKAKLAQLHFNYRKNEWKLIESKEKETP